VALGALAALGLFAALGALAWTRPAERDVTVAGAWAHAGAFSYTASVAPSAVYPTGRIATGDTVFTRLAKRLDVAFDYRLESRAAADVRGAVALGAVLSDGEGWSRRLTLAPAEPFAGTSARVVGTLDLRAVGTLVERMRRLTGSTATLFTVTVQPVVEVAGYAGPTVLDERYAPALRLALDASGLRPAPSSDGAASAFAVRRPGPAVVSAPAVLRLGPVAVDVARARLLGGLGVGVSLLVALVALGVALRTRPDAREAARRRFGARLVDADARVPESRWVTDVARADELARIAEHYDRVVLRTTSDDADVYLVDDGVTVYRLVVRPDGAAVRSGVVVGGW
jgi:hypothetical protein